eukprot:TRINITY_DN2828_c0_g1_i3.p1 TRINITY_DN2828_c0_g1~~TRINITY_DN2828_c0_g1_i3.p1  ORF type:complete len:260 (-),score=38.00 TRINITY_DN2828_c0_g1_i3:651-1319(-)
MLALNSAVFCSRGFAAGSVLRNGAVRAAAQPRMLGRARASAEPKAAKAKEAEPKAAKPKEAKQSAPPATSSEQQFSNKQIFIVPEEAQAAFKEAWSERARHMETMDGFEGFSIDQDGETFTVVSKWASIPKWEAFNLSKAARRSHLPVGIWQMVPETGDGFPEDFVPFYEMNSSVMAKYPPKPKRAKQPTFMSVFVPCSTVVSACSYLGGMAFSMSGPQSSP